MARRYDEQGADELVFLDITASAQARSTRLRLASAVARNLFIPFTVGGGIGSLEEMRRLLAQGCDKISINTAAVSRPQLISEAAKRFGSQCVVVAIDAKKRGQPTRGQWEVYIHGGRRPTGKDAVKWAKEAADRGAGEILLTSIDCDGTKAGYDLALTLAVSSALPIPVIASGGAGKLEHLAQAFTQGKADAVLAASIFHYGEFTIPRAKRYLKRRGIPVRI